MVIAAEIEVDHGLPVETATISAELQYVVASVKSRPTCKKITHNAAAKYYHTVMKQVNVSKEAHDKQRKNTRTVLIKVSILSNNRPK